ncbi:hypothetical protein RchiOBHm_Chr5g0044541 [Rosa chinensis]|uniref:Uncharacterized protein n=1 Tax=Rosa chinensis TaxID=74649 RepID=A0A2P6QDL5_ROSCH|nr:hypothetical protein RchiOBHm_Chr5g0044541 [Rosa chinensis]
MAKNCKFVPLYQYDFFMKVVRNCVFYIFLENHDNPTVNSFSIKDDEAWNLVAQAKGRVIA